MGGVGDSVISAQETELLLEIQRAQTTGWGPCLRQLAQITQAARALLYLPDETWSQTGRSDRILQYDSLNGLRPGRVYSGEELASRSVTDQRPFQGEDCRAIRLRGAAPPVWLVLERDKGIFRAIDSAILSVVAPHVDLSYTQLAERSALQAAAAQAQAVTRRLGIGVLRLDRRAEIIAQDDTAALLLARLGSRLSRPPDPARLQLVALAPWLDMLWCPDVEGGATAYLRAIDMPLPSAEVLAQVLRLTRSEAALARALGMGATLNEAAAQLGLTIETARAYSKQIFAKTGTRGQPALMRKLWTSALVLV